MTQHRDPPRSVGRILALFVHIADGKGGGLTLAELSAALDCPKSSLLILLRPLVDGKYLIHEFGRYYLGPEVFGFASRLLANSRFGMLIKHYMNELRDATGETVIFATLDQAKDSVAYVSVVESPQVIRYSVEAGALRPLYCTAAGRMLLAYKDEAWREAYLARTVMDKYTTHTLSDIASLRILLQQARRASYCFSTDEAILGAGGVAAVVLDAQGEVSGALVVAAPAQRALENRELLEKLTMQAARGASLALGCTEYDRILTEKSLGN